MVSSPPASAMATPSRTRHMVVTIRKDRTSRWTDPTERTSRILPPSMSLTLLKMTWSQTGCCTVPSVQRLSCLAWRALVRSTWLRPVQEANCCWIRSQRWLSRQGQANSKDGCISCNSSWRLSIWEWKATWPPQSKTEQTNQRWGASLSGKQQSKESSLLGTQSVWRRLPMAATRLPWLRRAPWQDSNTTVAMLLGIRFTRAHEWRPAITRFSRDNTLNPHWASLRVAMPPKGVKATMVLRVAGLEASRQAGGGPESKRVVRRVYLNRASRMSWSEGSMTEARPQDMMARSAMRNSGELSPAMPMRGMSSLVARERRTRPRPISRTQEDTQEQESHSCWPATCRARHLEEGKVSAAAQKAECRLSTGPLRDMRLSGSRPC